MKRIKIIFLVVLFSLTKTIFSQGEAHYSQYMFNGLYVNPAYAGSRGGFSAVALYRHQWHGVENGPRSANLSMHAPISNGLFSVGVHVNNDRLGVMIMNSAFATFAVRFKLAQGANASRLAIGVQGGFKHFNINNREVNGTLPVNDPAFMNNFSGIGINTGAGIYLDAPNYFVGFSMPYLLTNDIVYGNGTGEMTTKVDIKQMPMIASTGVIFNAGSAMKIKPSVFVKYQYAMPIDIDLTLGFHIKEVFFIGGTYRVNNAAIAMAAINLSNNLRVGYAYELSLNNSLKSINTGTHEIMLGIDFMNKGTNSAKCNGKVINPRQFRYF